jgi:serine protease Do
MKKFLAFVILVFLCVGALYQWRSGRDAEEERRVPEKYTPATDATVELKDVHLLAQLDREYTRLVDAVVPSVVSITTSRRIKDPTLLDPFEQLFGRRIPPGGVVKSALGSGVIVSQEGHIVTNTHVIANYDEIRIQLTDGRLKPAKLIGADTDTDIAVLKIDASDLTPLALGDSDEVKTGQIVFAIGNPFGLQETVTQGIISATGRRVQEDSGNEFFQTDTAINQGNSGGPLVNLRGEIIGINSVIFSGDKAGGWLGVSFAIPSNVVAHAVESIVRTGQVVRSYLGIGIQPLTPELAQEFGLSTTKGALVSYVSPGSPAERAGLIPGDVITKLDDHVIADIRELQRRVSRTEIGTSLEITFIRSGATRTINATVVEAGGAPPTADAGQPDPPSQIRALDGVTVAPIPEPHREKLPQNVVGVMVVRVAPDSPASRILLPGDVIEEINRTPIPNPDRFREAVEALAPGEKALLSISQDGRRMFVVVQP